MIHPFRSYFFTNHVNRMILGIMNLHITEIISKSVYYKINDSTLDGSSSFQRDDQENIKNILMVKILEG
jgi:hypothetical protein